MTVEEQLRTALLACWDEFHDLMHDALYEEVKQALGIREFEGRVGWHAKTRRP